MHSNAFVQCCGINIIAGFPFDASDDYTASQLAEIIPELEMNEGTYAPCVLIALNHEQTMAAAEIEKAGYELVGDFPSAHKDGNRVNLYAKGLTVFVDAPAKARPKPKALLRKFLAKKRGKKQWRKKK